MRRGSRQELQQQLAEAERQLKVLKVKLAKLKRLRALCNALERRLPAEKRKSGRPHQFDDFKFVCAVSSEIFAHQCTRSRRCTVAQAIRTLKRREPAWLGRYVPGYLEKRYSETVKRLVEHARRRRALARVDRGLRALSNTGAPTAAEVFRVSVLAEVEEVPAAEA
jgi:hypothetical protein